MRLRRVGIQDTRVWPIWSEMLNASQQSELTVREVLPYRSSHASAETTAALAANTVSTIHLRHQGGGGSRRGPSGFRASSS